MAYRQSPFANLTPVVKNLLIINLICFLPFLLFDHGDKGGPVTEFFGVHYLNAPGARPWQYITYMFMHGGWQHIFFNMFGLFMFGPILEYAIGPKKFLNLYIICGIGAVVFQTMIQAFEVYNITGGITISNPGATESYYQYGAQAQKLYDIYHSNVVGASGALFGVLVAFAMLYPDLEMMILFVPVPVKAKYLIPVYIVIEIWSTISPSPQDNVAHLAHLGGALVGFALIKIWRYR
ncbi:MAG TPA: rhomboid family intramembrane serine protease [Mucilaginibacter sp.]|jgi:rhomboid-like protein|nr:rhomboid family intramembrane serine protease [Mucilaginibacter sp.]